MSLPVSIDRTILPVPSAAAADPSAIDIREQTPAFEMPVDLPAPDGAPNVVVILLDDMGFGASSAFGGPCQMPQAERLAAEGLRYTRFHTTAICSSTRAALLTGRNHHSVGFGHLVDQATAAPGYTTRLPESAATLARTLTLNGFATGAFGKMHQTPGREVSSVGPFARWPTGREGFEQFYGFLGGEINHWYPTLFDGTTPVEARATPEEGYHLSEDLVDRAVDWVQDVRMISPGKPFFCYLPFGATHVPFHVKPEWARRYRGKFDHGWDRQRELTLGRQKELGIVPRDTALAPWADGVPHWDELDEEDRAAACALMELYAGYAEHADAQVGRFVDALRRLGVLDDTLILFILGDNGAAPEGGLTGTVNTYAVFNGLDEGAKSILAQRDQLGGPDSWPHYPVGWALAMDTPYQWTKHVASHYGGTRNGLIVHWPNGINEPGGLRHQWHHVIDVAPTILEAVGVPAPVIVDGAQQQTIEGTALNYTFNVPDAPERHLTQYFEIAGTRGIYHEGWVACTAHAARPWAVLDAERPALRDDRWELYDTNADWSQSRDLAAQEPDRLASLRELFMIEAVRHQVLPLDDRALPVRRNAADRPSVAAMTFHPRTRRVPADAMPNVIGTSHLVAARIHVGATAANGVICAQGGQFSGWSLYCRAGVLTYCHNVGGSQRYYVRADAGLRPGGHDLRYEFDYDGGALGSGGIGRILVDGEVVGRERINRTVAFLFPIGEDFNVGVDPLTPVSDEYRRIDNAFSGEIEFVRIEVTGGTGIDAAQRLRMQMSTQ